MILKIPENRKRIIEYLNNINEDTFIDEIVIPLFGSQGFQVYRINSHSSGEHGKDIIFCRYIPIFFENEFVVVQAKAESVSTSNVTKFSDQVKRSLKTKFAPRSGNGDLYPHYAIFINAKKHSNDAYTEFPQLVNSQHVKILSQENVCELIMQTGIAPQWLLNQLSTNTPETQSKDDRMVLDTILSNKPAEIDSLLDHKLKFLKDQITPRTKQIIIDYIYDRWNMDRSWFGTVKPMKWFDNYFDFFVSGRQYEYLIDIFKELTSTTPSYDALSYTSSVVRKVAPEMLSVIADPFTRVCAEQVLSSRNTYRDLVLDKLKDLKDSNLVENSELKQIMGKILNFANDQYDDSEYEDRREEIQSFAYPELAEHRKKRRGRQKS